MSITTKKGDDGESDLLFEGRALKGDVVFRCMGEMDMLQAQLGVLRAKLPVLHKRWQGVSKYAPQGLAKFDIGFYMTGLEKFVTRMQIDVQAGMGAVAANVEERNRTTNRWEKLFCGKKISELEVLIHGVEEVLKTVTPKGCGFLRQAYIVPGADSVSAQSNLCRTQCRKAESCLWELIQYHCNGEENQYKRETLLPLVARFLNRMSDVLFIMTRYIGEVVMPIYFKAKHEKERLKNAQKQPRKLLKKLRKVKTLSPLQKNLLDRITDAYKGVDLLARRKNELILRLEKMVIEPVCLGKGMDFHNDILEPAQRFLTCAEYLAEFIRRMTFKWAHYTWVSGTDLRTLSLEVLIDGAEPIRRRYRMDFEFKLDAIFFKVFYLDNESKVEILGHRYPYGNK